MPLDGWFWLVVNVILIAALIRQGRLLIKVTSVPPGWPHVSEESKPREGDHATDSKGC